jgi:hypothetical protein
LVGLGYGFHTGASVTDSMDAAVDRLVVETLDFYAREGARARAPESAGPGGPLQPGNRPRLHPSALTRRCS